MVTLYLFADQVGQVVIKDVFNLAPLSCKSRSPPKHFLPPPYNAANSAKRSSTSRSAAYHPCSSFAFSFASCTSTLWDLMAASTLVVAAAFPHTFPSTLRWEVAAAFCIYAAFRFMSTALFTNGFSWRHLQHAHALRTVAPVTTALIISQCAQSFAQRWCFCCYRDQYLNIVEDYASTPKSGRLSVPAAATQALVAHENSGSLAGDTCAVGIYATNRRSPYASCSAPFSSHASPRVMPTAPAIWQQVGFKSNSVITGFDPAASVKLGPGHQRDNMHESHAKAASSPKPSHTRGEHAADTARLADFKAQWHRNGFCVSRSKSGCVLPPSPCVMPPYCTPDRLLVNCAL